MGSGEVVVAVRTTGEAYSEPWVVAGRTSTLAPRPIPLLREILESDRVVARATPYLEDPRTLIFELDAASTRQAIEQVATACHWTMP